MDPRGGGGRKPEIHNLCPLVPKMHHIKFEKNWSSDYQVEVKNLQNVNRHYISCLALPWGQNCYPMDYRFHNFDRGLLALHYHAFSFSSKCAVVEKKIFENW
jgi:hypothetical protein